MYKYRRKHYLSLAVCIVVFVGVFVPLAIQSVSNLLITVIFGHTSPTIGERIKEKLYFYAACLRASVSKLADTMEAHT